MFIFREKMIKMAKVTCSECGEEYDDTEHEYIIEVSLNEHELKKLDLYFLCLGASMPFMVRRKYGRKWLYP